MFYKWDIDNLIKVCAFKQKRVYYRVTNTFIWKSLLAEAPNPYHDWFTSLNFKKVIIKSCNKGRGGKKALSCIKQNYTAIDILWYYFYCLNKTIQPWKIINSNDSLNLVKRER